MIRQAGLALASLVMAALLMPAAALAGPPYTTDDPGVLGAGEPEVIAYFDAVLAPGADTGEAGIDASVGLAGGIQIGVIAPLHSFEAGRDRFALGDVTLAAKIALADGDVGVAFGPALPLPTGSKGRTRAGINLPLWIGTSRGHWTVHGGGGYRLAADRDGGDLPFGGLVVTHALTERITLGGEIYAEGKGSGGAAFAMAGPGLEWALSEAVTLTAAAHAILANRGENGDVHIYAALVVTP